MFASPGYNVPFSSQMVKHKSNESSRHSGNVIPCHFNQRGIPVDKKGGSISGFIETSSSKHPVQLWNMQGTYGTILNGVLDMDYMFD